jgi:hypothetical protein
VLLSVDAPRTGGRTAQRSVVQDLRAGCVPSSAAPPSARPRRRPAWPRSAPEHSPTAVLLGIRTRHAAAGALLITAFGAGTQAGSLLVARYPVGRRPAYRVALVCLVGTGLALAVVVVTPPGWALGIGLFVVAGRV